MPLDLAATISSACTGRGARLESVSELETLNNHCRTHGLFICNVETFKIRGEYEVPRLDLSLYGLEESERARPDVVDYAAAIIDSMMALFAAEGGEYVFQVWLWDDKPIGADA